MTNYNPNYIKHHISYTIKDVCNIYIKKRLSEKNVLKWIHEEGLPLIDNKKPYMIHGKILYEFLRYRNAMSKQHMNFNHFYCLRTRKAIIPIQKQIFANLQGKIIRCKGICPCCSKEVYRSYKLNDYTKLRSFFNMNNSEILKYLNICNDIKQQTINIDYEVTNEYNKAPKFKDIIQGIRYNPNNERIKYKYLNTKLSRYSTNTQMDYIKALHTYEEFLGYASLSMFNFELGKEYKQHVLNRKNKQGHNISYSVQYKELKNVQEFLYWLSHQRGFKSKLDYNDIDSLTVERNLIRRARSSGGKDVYTLGEVKQGFSLAPTNELIERRAKATLACFILFTPRITALSDLKISDVKYDKFEKTWYLDQTKVETKFAHKFVSFAYKLDPCYLEYLQSWIKELKESYDCKPTDYLFPKIDNRFNKSLFNHKSIDNKKIGCQAIRNGLKKIFESSGLEYINPHNFRHTIKRTADSLEISQNQAKALELNIGHSPAKTIDCHYGDNTRAFQSKYINTIDFTTLDN